MFLTRLIPVMFHRRLLLLLSIMAAGVALLTLQLGNLTLLKGDESRRQAEGRLRRQQWTPTIRGRILDRKDRVLVVPDVLLGLPDHLRAEAARRHRDP